MEGQVIAPGGQRRGVDQGDHRLDHVRRADVQVGRLRHALRAQLCRPVVARILLLQLREGAHVPGLVTITQPDLVPLRPRHGGFQRQHRLGARFRVGSGDASKTEHALDMVEVCRADLHESRIAIEIVIAIRQAQTADAKADLIAIGILAIGSDVEAERRITAVDCGAPEGVDQGRFRVDCGDPVQHRTQWRDAGGIAGGTIHVAAVEVADLLRIAAGGKIGALAQALDQTAHLFVCLIAQRIETAVGRLVGLELVAGYPVAAGIAVEVIPRSHRRITGAQVDAETAHLRTPGGCCRGGIRGHRSGRGKGQRKGEAKSGQTQLHGQAPGRWSGHVNRRQSGPPVPMDGSSQPSGSATGKVSWMPHAFRTRRCAAT